jgi:hypothetical protein
MGGGWGFFPLQREMSDNIFLFVLEFILIAVGFALIFAFKESDPNKKLYTNVGISGVVIGGVGMLIHVLMLSMFR